MTTEQLKLLIAIIESKNSWGKNEMIKLILEIASNVRKNAEGV